MFTIGNLSFEDQGTGVIYGFLRQIQELAVRFDFPNFIFCWDSNRSFRRDIYPDYKKKKGELTEEMVELLAIAKPQFQEIRTKVLPRLGFSNSFIQTGVEADDLIAWIVQDYVFRNGDCIMVSSDNDLYQLLNHRIQMYDLKNKSFYTVKDFIEEWKIEPDEWAQAKAIAGCNGDNVKGISRVGLITAIKYLRGKLTGKKRELIQNSKKLILFNLGLVYLPHPETKPVTIQKDRFNFHEFECLCMDYGFTSLLKKGVYEKWKQILK